MKKILLIMLAAGLLFSCQKKETEIMPVMQDVVFAAEWINPDNLKSTNDEDPPDVLFPCSDLSADYAWVILNGQSYFPELYTLGDKIYTQAMKLPVLAGNAPYSISQFWLMHDNGNNGNGPEDIPVMGTPMGNSDYNIYVSTPLSFGFSVNEFSKAEIPIQVLCVQEQNIQGFGFDWFAIQEIVVREKCFFGDICLNGEPYKPIDFAGVHYGTNLGVDVPAIMRIRVELNGIPVPNSPFYNIEWKGIGAPLCIQYPDNLMIDNELFRIFLDVLVLDDQGDVVYLNYAFFTITDDGPLMYDGNPVGVTDNILDFVVGTCNYSPADITFDWKPAPFGQVALVGEFNHWGLDIPPISDHLMTRDGVDPYYWTTSITLEASDNMYGEEDPIIIEMKFRKNQQWTINWGAVDFPNGTGVQDGLNIPVPLTTNPITYDVTFNQASGAYTFTEWVAP